MLGVLLFRDGIPFLITWELMAVSSFLLILFEAEKRATLKTAVNYMIQMHVGMVILVIAFLIAIVMGMTIDRFDARRGLVVDEANAIGTAYLRAGYINPQIGEPVRELLREYLPLRITIPDAAQTRK